jgi:L-gulonolactone oxidase
LLRCSRGVAFSNWAGNQRCQPLCVHNLSSEDEISDVLRRASHAKVSCKVVGAGHSFSDVACTDGYMLRLDGLRRLIRVDRDAKLVTVQAGMRLRTLNAALARHGLALGNLGSVSEQTVGGAIATGTHGTGIRLGSLSTLVRNVRLVKADGSVLDLSRTDGDVFEAARLHLGCLGVVTQVTLRCEPAFCLREKVFSVRFDDVLETIPSLVDRYDHVKLWWLPHTDEVQVITMRRVPHEASGRGHDTRVRVAGVLDTVVNRGVFAGLLRVGAWAPSAVPAINRGVGRLFLRPRQRTDRSDRILTLPMPPKHREMEYGIPCEVASLALRRLRDLVRGLRIAVDFVVEVRFVAHDTILLSNAYRRDSCQIGAYIGEHPHRAIYFDAFETLCRQLDGRPHWGKEFDARESDLRTRVPGLRRFLKVRKTLDPHKLFDNRFTRRVLGE